MSSIYALYCGTSHENMKVLYYPGMNDDSYDCYNICWKQEVSEAGELIFTLPQTHWAYNSMKSLITLVEIRIVISDGTEKTLWEGRVYSTQRDFYNQKTVKCEGALAYLNDTLQMYNSKLQTRPATKREFIKAILYGYEGTSVVGHNSQSGSRAILVSEEGFFPSGIGDQVPSISDLDADSYITSLEMLQRLLEDDDVVIELSFHTYYDTLTQTTKWGRFLDVWENSAEAENGKLLKSQVIQFGENMLDLEECIVSENIVNCIMPFGAMPEDKTDDMTITSRLQLSGGTEEIGDSPAQLAAFSKKYLYGYYIADEDNVIRYMRADSSYAVPPIWQVVTFDDVTGRYELLKQAEEYLHNYIFKTLKIELSAVDLNYAGVNVDNIVAGRYYECVSDPHGFDDKLLCSAATIYPQNPEKDKYTLGYTGKTLSDDVFRHRKDIRNIKQTVQLLSKSKSTVRVLQESSRISIDANNVRYGTIEIDGQQYLVLMPNLAE